MNVSTGPTKPAKPAKLTRPSSALPGGNGFDVVPRRAASSAAVCPVSYS